MAEPAAGPVAGPVAVPAAVPAAVPVVEAWYETSPGPSRTINSASLATRFNRLRTRLIGESRKLRHPVWQPNGVVEFFRTGANALFGAGALPGAAAIPVAPPVDGWDLVQKTLKWCLRSDGQIVAGGPRAAFRGLPAADRLALIAFMGAKAAELAAIPLLSAKSISLRLQFVALGQNWFDQLLESPTLVFYLEEESQVVDLEKEMRA